MNQVDKVLIFWSAVLLAGVGALAVSTSRSVDASHQKHMDEHKERMKRWDESHEKLMKSIRKRSVLDPPYSTRLGREDESI